LGSEKRNTNSYKGKTIDFSFFAAYHVLDTYFLGGHRSSHYRENCRKPPEKRLIPGYTPRTANAIFAAYNNFRINSFADLRQHLNQEQTDEILSKFDRITQFQLDYFQLSRNDRDSSQATLLVPRLIIRLNRF